MKVVPGSHLFRDPAVSFLGDTALQAGWVDGKTHSMTGEPLQIEELECPPGSVIIMWTHAVHGVSARKDGSDTRWAVATAYRNPGAPSHGR